MKQFDHVQDLREWLEPMTYEEFWEAIEPYKIINIISKENCDHDLQNEVTYLDNMLYCLKGMAENEIVIRFALTHREELIEGITVH